MIVFENVAKKYGDVVGVNSTSFSVDKGELFGLIGPDGAGKTTLMRLLATLLLPDSGTMKFNNIDVVENFRSVRNSIGYMPGSFALYTDLTVEENLKFFARVFSTSIEQNYHLIKNIYDQLLPFKKRRAGALSGGMKQKLALSCALIHSPLALILDEPTTGVDAVSRTEFWSMLSRLKQSGMTILVSTPYMEEAVLCDRIGLLNNGTMMIIGSPSEIIAGYDKSLWSLKGQNNMHLLTALRNYKPAHAVYVYRDKVMLSTADQLNESDLTEYLSANGIHDVRIEQTRPDVEDCFMELAMSSP